ncbi:MAG: PEP-CTERM sorting domain-containing protein [Microcystaceae cyanobacterium]
MFKKFALSIAGSIAILSVPNVVQALTLVPDDLKIGDEYRLVFVTDEMRDALSTNITDYNQFVTDDVRRSVLATELRRARLTPDWFAIASTADISARENTSTTGTGGVPIYLITGERIADNYGDLWDGSIQTEIDTTPDNSVVNDSVWTGTNTNGSGRDVLGSSQVTFGSADFANSSWVFRGTFLDEGASIRFYGISSVLVKTPEPSSLLGFITLGGLMLGTAVRRARK